MPKLKHDKTQNLYLKETRLKLHQGQNEKKSNNQANEKYEYYELYGDYEGTEYNNTYIKMYKGKIVDCVCVSDSKARVADADYRKQRKQIYLDENKEWLLAELLGKHKEKITNLKGEENMIPRNIRARPSLEKIFNDAQQEECRDVLNISEKEYRKLIIGIIALKESERNSHLGKDIND